MKRKQHKRKKWLIVVYICMSNETYQTILKVYALYNFVMEGTFIMIGSWSSEKINKIMGDKFYYVDTHVKIEVMMEGWKLTLKI